MADPAASIRSLIDEAEILAGLIRRVERKHRETIASARTAIQEAKEQATPRSDESLAADGAAGVSRTRERRPAATLSSGDSERELTTTARLAAAESAIRLLREERQAIRQALVQVSAAASGAEVK